MAVLKWLAMVVASGYLGGLGILYFKQRSMLFPIPPVPRTAPAAAGLPEAEEHVLATADGERSSFGTCLQTPAMPSSSIFQAMAIFSPAGSAVSKA